MIWCFVFSRLVMSNSLQPCGLQPSLSFIIYQSFLKFMSIELMMHTTISSSVAPFSSCPQSFPASGSFPMSWLFTSCGQSIGASASVLPMNIQGWFPLGLTGFIFLQSKGLSRVFSNTTIQRHRIHHSAFFMVQFTSIQDYWENHSFDYTDLFQQSDFSAF